MKFLIVLSCVALCYAASLTRVSALFGSVLSTFVASSCWNQVQLPILKWILYGFLGNPHSASMSTGCTQNGLLTRQSDSSLTFRQKLLSDNRKIGLTVSEENLHEGSFLPKLNP